MNANTTKSTFENTGLNESVVLKINKVFAGFENIKEVHIFGSRVKNTFKAGSDIDLVIMHSDVNPKELISIESKLEALLLPYKIDLCVYEKLENIKLIEHIDRLSRLFYDQVAYAKNS